MLKTFWVMVFGSETRPTVKDLIFNAVPLTLIYRLLSPFRRDFLQFLRFIWNCCHCDLNSALMLNHTDFPSMLSKSIAFFRPQTGPDPL
jgi:hypothetical protein